MKEKRLGGRGVTIPERKILDQIHIYTMPSMEAARERYRAAFCLRPWTKRRDLPQYSDIERRMMNGDRQAILDHADRLIDEAVLIDPRLVRRSSWVMAEDGMDACPAMIASGEERAFLDRRKMRLSERATAEPVRIVISTDSKRITGDNAAAFIAAAKLAQQFRPLEIWWQGAWLIEEPPPGKRLRHPEEIGFGHIIHVPLIQGDLDFSRLQFVLSDPGRDSCSFYIMASYAYPQGYGWNGGVAERSYLPDTFDFIRESGMDASAEQVARYAAKWAGLDSAWAVQVSAWEAVQSWEPQRNGASVDEATRRRWARESEQINKREKEKKAAAAYARAAEHEL